MPVTHLSELFHRFPAAFLPVLVISLLLTTCGPPTHEHTPEVAPPPVALPTTAPSDAASASKPAPDSVLRFEWASENCRHEGFYKKGFYNKKQLQETQPLVESGSVLLQANVFISQPAYYTTAYVQQLRQALDREYAAVAGQLRTADVVPTSYWQNIKRHRLLELDEFYQLEQLTIEAYFRPNVLLHTPYGRECNEFAKALASADSAVILQAWRELVDAQKQRNGAPELLEENYNAQYNSPDRLTYAKIDLLTFGWHTCANHQRKQPDYFDKNPVYPAFNKLFYKVDSVCDDVD